MALKVAINGTGRVGLIATRILSKRDDIALVALNSTASQEMLVHLLKYDTVHGGVEAKIIDKDYIQIADKKIRVFSSRDPTGAEFGKEGAKVVLECTGAFLTTTLCEQHLRDGVEKVVISAPAKDDTSTYVFGVNHQNYNNEAIVSNASCTTNCLAPVCKVLDDEFGIENGLMTTIHSYTNDQNVLDVKHKKDFRRARAAAVNLIPTTTGAAKAIGLVMPHLKGKLNGYAMRVPTPDVSIVDLTLNLKKSTTKEEINQVFEKAANSNFKNLIEVDYDKRVSSDFVGSKMSSVFIPDMTSVVDGKIAKVLSWYDNEWGYSNRCVELLSLMS